MSGYLADIYARHGTEIWCDSPGPPDLGRLAALGTLGATSNPVLIQRTVEAQVERWRREAVLCRSEPGLPHWTMTRQVVREAAAILEPLFRATGGRHGLVSVEVDPHLRDDAAGTLAQAREAHTFAPNISVKIPATEAGLVVIEALAAESINCTATISFAVAQVIAIAEAFRRGRARTGKPGTSSTARPTQSFAVVMVGRLDTYFREVAAEQGIDVRPGLLENAGIAVAKQAYRLLRERGYESRLLVAAVRDYSYVKRCIGGHLVITVPPAVEQAFGQHVGNQVPPSQIDEPVPDEIVDELCDRFVDFRRAYLADGMRPEEFGAYRPAAQMLDQFSEGWDWLVRFVG